MNSIARFRAPACALLVCLPWLGNARDSLETALVLERHPLAGPLEHLEPEVLDFRYRPERWQACLGLPDDPFKTIIGSDGGLYYKFGQGPPEYEQFEVRLLAELEAQGERGSRLQELYGARVPIVTTRQRCGGLELQQVAWAGAPEGAAVVQWAPRRRDFLWLTASNASRASVPGKLRLEVAAGLAVRLDDTRTRLVEEATPERAFCSFSRPCDPAAREPARSQLQIVSPRHRAAWNWAAPNKSCDEIFHHALVGEAGPLVFNFPVEKGRHYNVAFGLIEGWHHEPGKRPLEIRLEGKVVRKLDLVRDYGRNTPVVLAFSAQDEDGDGQLTLAVSPVEGAEDRNTILSGLWIFPAEAAPEPADILSGKATRSALAFASAARMPRPSRPLTLSWNCGALAPRQRFEVLVTVPQGELASRNPGAAAAAAELERAVRFWESAPLPYDRIRVPDAAVQALLDSCIRNLYQARELKNGQCKFQVGPTCYRGSWAADGAFILETIACLGRPMEARAGLEQQIDKDDGPGGVEFSKKAGLRLWLLWRHAQLTGDRQWLRQMWPRVVREVQQIEEYRRMTRSDQNQPNYGLMPAGFGDGGLGGPFREYSNVYWTLAGLRAAIEAAHWLNEPADAWQAEFDDYWAVFDKARNRDRQTDNAGNTYVPPVMKGEPAQLPQRGAWAFLQSIYPGRIFAPDDPLMRGTLAMLDSNQCEGLVFGTGWIADGVWNYAGSFYAHAHLWLGHGRKAAATLYAFGNHACPLLCWREEQKPAGQSPAYCGDMPHNWASAEFIRLIRHLIVLERGPELHLLEGLPSAWTKPGAQTRLTAIPTSFGPMSLALRIAPDGRAATLDLDPPRREPITKIVVHLEPFAHEADELRVDGQPLAGPGLAIPTTKAVSVTWKFKD